MVAFFFPPEMFKQIHFLEKVITTQQGESGNVPLPGEIITIFVNIRNFPKHPSSVTCHTRKISEPMKYTSLTWSCQQKTGPILISRETTVAYRKS